MSKYIIRNCPMYFHDNCYGHTGNCDYAMHGAKATGYFNFLGEKILGLLDIQEVE